MLITTLIMTTLLISASKHAPILLILTVLTGVARKKVKLETNYQLTLVKKYSLSLFYTFSPKEEKLKAVSIHKCSCGRHNISSLYVLT